MTPDRLVQGVLTKIGDIFDRLTGRGWRPSSSLATSELAERLKGLLDSEVKIAEDGRRYVPHNIKLKMQWDKFSSDAEDSMKKLESEFLIAAIDHINDRHYYTFAPLNIEVKPDYFTAGVKLQASFESFDEDEREAEIDVLGKDGATAAEAEGDGGGRPQPNETSLHSSGRIEYEVNGKKVSRPVAFTAGTRLSIGRTKENDVAVDDISVSKYHATLFFDDSGRLFVGDTGSTNGTFVDGQRISYGKAVELIKDSKLRIGGVELKVSLTGADQAASETNDGIPATMEFRFDPDSEAVD